MEVWSFVSLHWYMHNWRWRFLWRPIFSHTFSKLSSSSFWPRHQYPEIAYNHGGSSALGSFSTRSAPCSPMRQSSQHPGNQLWTLTYSRNATLFVWNLVSFCSLGHGSSCHPHTRRNKHGGWSSQPLTLVLHASPTIFWANVGANHHSRLLSPLAIWPPNQLLIPYSLPFLHRISLRASSWSSFFVSTCTWPSCGHNSSQHLCSRNCAQATFSIEIFQPFLPTIFLGALASITPNTICLCFLLVMPNFLL